MTSHFVRVALLLFGAALAFSQTSSQQISGFVRDASGLVVSSAKITVRNVGTGLSREAQVNESGFYSFTNLPIGIYEIDASATGFKRYLQKEIKLDVNAKVTVDVLLDVGSVNESITVTTDAAQVEVGSGEIGRLVTGTQA